MTEREAEALVAEIKSLPLKEFDFHGFKGNRRVISFDWRYPSGVEPSARQRSGAPGKS